MSRHFTALLFCASTLALLSGCSRGDSSSAARPSPTGQISVTSTPVDLTSSFGSTGIEIRMAGVYDQLSTVDFVALGKSVSLVDENGTAVPATVVVKRPMSPSAYIRPNYQKGQEPKVPPPPPPKTESDDEFTTSSELGLVRVVPTDPLKGSGWYVLRWARTAIPNTYFSPEAQTEGEDTALVRFAVGSLPVVQRVVDCNGKLSLFFSEPVMWESLVQGLEIQGTQSCRFSSLDPKAVETGTSTMASVASLGCPTGDSVSLSASMPISSASGSTVSLMEDSTLHDMKPLGSEPVTFRWKVEAADGCRIYSPGVKRR